MSEIKLISPLLDNIDMGEPISDRFGVRACPAMSRDEKNKYIVKIVSSPASRTQMDALLLSGAYPSEEAALSYFKELSEGIVSEAQILQKLSALEGFVGFEGWQTEVLSDNAGYDVYLLGAYRKTLERVLSGAPMTHLAALNLGMDLCTALSVCRQCGYLYVSLKPSNIYMTGDNSFKIGDIGFIKLDSLKYASLPDRCRSAYTAPEIQDAYSSLNTTLDTYAVGMILYQVFNGGQLPQPGDGPLPAPDYADYEMAEIILKACAANPDDRWQDPNDLVQALISYMQRNGAHDTPIIPQLIPDVPSEAETVTDELPANENEILAEDITSNSCEISEEESTDETEITADSEQEVSCEGNEETDDGSLIADDVVVVEETVAETPSDTDSAADNEPDDAANESSDQDEDPESLEFLNEAQEDETLPSDDHLDDNYEQISLEVTDMLNQADELISHPTPDPVIPPEPIDVPVPPPIQQEEPEPEEATESEETPSIEGEAVEQPDVNSDEQTGAEAENLQKAEPKNAEEPAKQKEEYYEEEEYRPKSHWLRNSILILLLLGIIAAGFLYYKYEYLQNVEQLTIIGSDDSLEVVLKTDIDDQLLEVICADTYGNKQVFAPTGGKVTFENLSPNTAYSIRLEIEGFHKLTGNTTGSYATPKRTSIVQFQARTGFEDGSVILEFSIEGTDSEQWKVLYSTEGTAPQETIFSGHNTTLTGLQIGREYSFELEPMGQITIDGTTAITHQVCKLIRAQDLKVTGISDGTLYASWTAPEDASVISWTVHCYNDAGYDQTLVTDICAVEFHDVTTDQSYTIDVKAAGMSISDQVTLEKNAITVDAYEISNIDQTGLTLNWTCNGTATAESWKVQCAIDGYAVPDVIVQETSARIAPYIPGATYQFTVLPEDGSPIFHNLFEYTTSEADSFDNYSVTADSMEFSMVRYPGYGGWSHYDLSYSDYTNTFRVGERASFVVHLGVRVYGIAYDEINILYVIRSEEGNMISYETYSNAWSSLWYNHYGELDLTSLPSQPGNYSVEIYFNGDFAGQQSFTVTE